MPRRFALRAITTLATLAMSLVLPSSAFAAGTAQITMASQLTPDKPVVDIVNSSGLSVSSAPALVIRGVLSSEHTTLNVATTWTQVSPTEIQAFIDPSAYLPKPGTFTPQFIPTLTYTVRAHLGCTSMCVPTRSMVAAGSVRWLQQLLAQTRYIPYTYTPTTSFNAVAAAPVAGSFSPRITTLPPTFYKLWQAGALNVITVGALMRLQDERGALVAKVPTTFVWRTLIAMVATHQVAQTPYNYVDVNSTLPQTLTLYINGVVKSMVAVNLGISAAPTAKQTDPVYARFKTTTMSGVQPDGQHYYDTGIPWVSYFNGGEALHGFIRPTYGTPQSLGCVEMMFKDAGKVWPYTPIGTLVTIR